MYALLQNFIVGKYRILFKQTGVVLVAIKAKLKVYVLITVRFLSMGRTTLVIVKSNA